MTRPANPDGRQPLVLVLTAAGGLLGGLLALALLAGADTDVGVAGVVFVLVAGTLATVLAYLLLTTKPLPRQQVPPRQAQPRQWHQQAAHRNHPPARGPAPEPAPHADPGHLVLPIDDGATGQDGGQWWNKSAPSVAAAGNRNNRQAPTLASYVAEGSALVAQCPNCGDFRIDVQRADPAFAFRCRNPRCGEEWRWTPGTAWPPVVVRRNLTGRERG
jgi:hypothetical protein